MGPRPTAHIEGTRLENPQANIFFVYTGEVCYRGVWCSIRKIKCMFLQTFLSFQTCFDLTVLKLTTTV